MLTITLTTSRWPRAWRSTNWLNLGGSQLIFSKGTIAGNKASSSARRTSSTRCSDPKILGNCSVMSNTSLIWVVLSSYRMPCSTHLSLKTSSWLRSSWLGSSTKTRRSVSPPAFLPATTCCGQMWCWKRPGGTTSWTSPCRTSSKSWGSTSQRWVGLYEPCAMKRHHALQGFTEEKV